MKKNNTTTNKYLGVSFCVSSYYTRNGDEKFKFRFPIAPQNGKRLTCQRQGFETEREAVAAAKKELDAYLTHRISKKVKDISVTDFLNIWLDDFCINNVKQSTLDGYQKKIKNYILPTLGRYYLKSISDDQLNDLLSNLFDDGFSRNTLSCIRASLSSSFRYAERKGYSEHNPAIDLEIPKKRNAKNLTRKHENVFIDESTWLMILKRFPRGSSAFLPMLISYLTGLRKGEVFGLCWEDIDFENKKIIVSHQIQWAPASKAGADREGFWYFCPTKTMKSRVVTMPDCLVDILKEEKERQIANKEIYGEEYYKYFTNQVVNHNPNCNSNDDFSNPILPSGTFPVNFVLVREDGSYTDSRVINHAARVIHKDIMPDFTFHSLRHTHCTNLQMHGYDLKYIADRLGHSNIDITMNVYSHLTETTATQNDNKLNDDFNTDYSKLC